MNELLIIFLTSLGTLFVLLAGVGLVRMPDLYLRISVTTKAATLGIGLILMAVALYFRELAISSRVLAIILFLLLTAPVAAHLIGRASYFIGVPLWKKSVMDELRGQYGHRDHSLASRGSAAETEADGEETPKD
jgi:multicomponent Na+:H+ antiporter subunit G